MDDPEVRLIHLPFVQLEVSLTDRKERKLKQTYPHEAGQRRTPMTCTFSFNYCER